MPSYGTPKLSAYKQTCEKCGETVQREADWSPLADCPRCRRPFPKPAAFTPKSGRVMAEGSR